MFPLITTQPMMNSTMVMIMLAMAATAATFPQLTGVVLIGQEI